MKGVTIMITVHNDYFVKKYDNELLVVEAWGNDSLRIRSFADRKFIDHNNALLDKPTSDFSNIEVKKLDDTSASIRNGGISAVLDHRNRLTFFNKKGEVILQEFIRLRAVKHDDGSEDVGTIEITKDFNSTLKLQSREYIANGNGANFKVTQRFESNNCEKIYGMGQYQHNFLNLKYTVLELAQRNSQMSIPFYVSSLGYGFLWNNPGIGKVSFSKNVTEWEMVGSKYIDYWITSGETPKKILEKYTSVTGRVPAMPDKYLGLWQSKLRYRTPEDVIEVLEGYKKRNIQISTIAIDYFHWPAQGEYKFDEKFWPNPKQLIETIKEEYNVEPIISIWPTVQSDAENYGDYLEGGYLVNVNRGIRLTMQIQGSTVFVDTTNPEARDYVWKRIEKNYKALGIDLFWIDVAEPGYSVYEFDNVRYHAGPVVESANLFPNSFLKMVYDGNQDRDSVVTLVRGAWAGAQRYGALAWSGDVDSSFESFKNQVHTGLNMGLAGIPWWTTDIGGFHGGNPEEQEFRELVIRWFQYATFSPVLRMHGDRLPHSKPLSNSGGGSMPTGAPNEIWSYGPEVENILSDYLEIREVLKPYLSTLMNEAHDNGSPIMRTLFYQYPEDTEAWEVENDTYMLGNSLLIAPIMNYKDRTRKVYLPKGRVWKNLLNGELMEGGQYYEVSAEIQQIPVFLDTSSSFDLSDLENLYKEK